MVDRQSPILMVDEQQHLPAVVERCDHRPKLPCLAVGGCRWLSRIFLGGEATASEQRGEEKAATEARGAQEQATADQQPAGGPP